MIIRFLTTVFLAVLVSGLAVAETEAPLSLGGLTLGQSSVAVVKTLGQPVEKGESREEMATGELVERWKYPALGLNIDLSHLNEKEPLTVYRILAGQPCNMRAYRGVTIGTFEAEVGAIARELEKTRGVEVSQRPGRGYGFLWVDEYQLLSLTLKNGKVSEICLGPGPE